MKKAIAVFQRHGSQWNPALPVREQAYWDDHARFVDELFDAGKIVLAGPFADGSGALVIMAVENVETARAVFREDPGPNAIFRLRPMSKNGRFFSMQKTG